MAKMRNVAPSDLGCPPGPARASVRSAVAPTSLMCRAAAAGGNWIPKFLKGHAGAAPPRGMLQEGRAPVLLARRLQSHAGDFLEPAAPTSAKRFSAWPRYW